MKLKRWMALVLSAALLAPVLPADGAIEVQAAEPAQERTELNFDTGWLYSNVDYSNGEAVNLNESDFNLYRFLMRIKLSTVIPRRTLRQISGPTGLFPGTGDILRCRKAIQAEILWWSLKVLLQLPKSM